MISKILKARRTQNGYTQQNIADFLGIDRSTYSYYETGKTQPSTDILARLSCLYQIGLDDFVPDSYRGGSVLELECAIPDGVSLYENTEAFSKLSFEEQQLVMNFRACPDKRRFISAIKDIVEQSSSDDETAE
jgi:transcriptional regulator with XRE-family HTH domain